MCLDQIEKKKEKKGGTKASGALTAIFLFGCGALNPTHPHPQDPTTCSLTHYE